MVDKKSANSGIFDFRLLIILAMLVFTQLTLSNFSQCIIEGHSMNDTLIGRNTKFEDPVDIVLLSRRFGALKYKDIIVFKHPDFSDPLIKRVIAVGGETIKFVKNQNNTVALYRLENEEYVLVNEDYIKNGVMGLFNADAVEYDEPIEIPLDSLFVMGDNRDNSRDSRFFGVIPTSYATAKMIGSPDLGKKFGTYKNVLIMINFILVLLYTLNVQLLERKSSLKTAMERYNDYI